MKTKIVLFISACLFLSSCAKDFLEEKSNQKLLVPNTLEDFQLLLDNYGVMNKTPGLGLIASDDFYISATGFNNLIEVERNAHTWKMNNTGLSRLTEWTAPYEQIFYSNVVLEGLEGFSNSNDVSYKKIKGQALFFRSYAMFGLLQVFTQPYREETAHESRSVPMALSADINAKRPIVSLKEAYDRITTDLKEAVSMLPETQNYKTRPSALAALSLLGRIYLITGNYPEAEIYLEAAYKKYHQLIDYNTLSVSSTRPFPTDYPLGPGNEEIIFYSPFISYGYLNYNNAEVRVTKTIYDSYETNDLRKHLYFRDRGNEVYTFKGSYGGSKRSDAFAGLSTDENYFNYMEVLIRNGQVKKGIDLLNEILMTRYKPQTYSPFTTTSQAEALSIVLDERSKSLIGKGTRWFDIRRFNHDPQFLIKAQKSLEGTHYELQLNDPRLAFDFPVNENE